MRPGWLGKAALVVCSALVTLGVAWGIGELALRWRERHRSDPPGTYATLFYRQIPLGYSMVRAYDYFGWVHIDSAGFRGPEVSLVWAPGVVRIMVVGASTTFDIRVTADSLAWPARLQGDVRRRNGRATDRGYQRRGGWVRRPGKSDPSRNSVVSFSSRRDHPIPSPQRPFLFLAANLPEHPFGVHAATRRSPECDPVGTLV